MKKYFNFALLSAIALTGTIGFTACSSSDDTVAEESKVENNPTYDPVAKTVTTQFVLNVAGGEMNATRQASATVQKASNFRGMQNTMLIGLHTGHSSYLAPFNGETGASLNPQYYDLGTLYAAGSISNTGTDNTDKSSHRVVELQLPLQTDAMLVYGRAIPVSPTDDEENGKVTYNVTNNSTSPTFLLNSRLESTTRYENYCKLIAEILNRIIKSEVQAQTLSSPAQTWPVSTEGLSAGQWYTQTTDLPALTWRELGNATGTLVPLQQNLATAYKAIKTVYTDASATHGGSAQLVRNMVADIYSIANSVTKAVATNDAEMNAQRLASNIKTRIEHYFNQNGVNFPFRALTPADQEGTILKTLSTNGVSITNYTGLNDTELESFPVSLKVPGGVAQLKFTEFDKFTEAPTSGGFEYLTASAAQSLIDKASVLDITKYTYPAEIIYFDNSALRVTDLQKTVAEYPNGITPWDTESQWSGWAVGPVASTTRSVAVKNNINYGVAMLNTKVVIDNTVTDFLDNRPAEENISFSKTELEKLQLTGVLIGGQYKEVGWNFLSTGDGTSGANKGFVIFDNKINTPAWATGVTPENYTLVFDNYKNSDTQDDVLVALEFTNGTGKDIYGKGGGMIPKDATFYLAAKLTLGSNVISPWPTTYAIPPYVTSTEGGKTIGSSQEITRVFVQDYETTATFKIGVNSLKNAYNTVPDLRATQTSLGLSVDLQWRSGLSFETVLGQ